MPRASRLVLLLACAFFGCNSKKPAPIPQVDTPQTPSESTDGATATGIQTPMSETAVSDESPNGGVLFADMTEASGVDFKHFSGHTGKHYIVETVTAGLATIDYDQDGLLDLYFLNGSPLLDVEVEIAPRNRLFKNLGGFRFEDVTESAGVGDTGFALGVAVGDYDNDGDQDLVVSNFGPNVLFENQGDGTFGRRDFESFESRRVGAGVALLDYDQDGNLDFYFANYVKFSFDKDVNREIFGVPAAPGPKDYEPDTDLLYRNSGNGSFEDVSLDSGIASVAGPGMGVVAFDYDADGDTDVFVCNDSAANFLFENRGDGSFDEIAVLASVAYDLAGAQQASMGVDVADMNHDGYLDLVTTNFVDEVPTLYKNSGNGYFDDVGMTARLGVANRSVTWGVGFADFNNDSWDDLYLAAGHLIEGVAAINDSEPFEAPNALLLSQDGVTFVPPAQSSPALNRAQVSRGVVVDDFDNDGRVDVATLNLNDSPQLIRNATEAEANSVNIHLVGIESSRDAIGARVQLHLGAQTLTKEKVAGRGYQGHFGSILHFGLGEHTGTVGVSITWPGGETETYSFDAAAQNADLLFVQGAKRPEKIVRRGL